MKDIWYSILSNIDVLNFAIAVIALFVAIYSIGYTRKFNQRKIFVSNGTFFLTQTNRRLHGLKSITFPLFQLLLSILNSSLVAEQRYIRF